MSDFRTKLLGIAALGIAMAGVSYGQTVVSTIPTAAVTDNTLRAEGETELVGDTQTTVTATNGVNIANVTVYATLSLPVTGKSLTGSLTANSTAALVVNGGAPIFGTVSGSTVTFTGVTLLASGGGTANTLLVQNVRVNASGAGNPSVTENLLIQYPSAAASGSSNTVGNSAGAPAVGYILPSLSTLIVSTPAATTPALLFPFTTCVGGTSLTLGFGSSSVFNATPSFYVQIKQLTAGAFRTQAQENEAGYATDATQGTEIAIAFANLPASATINLPLSVTASGYTLTLTGSPTTVTSPIPLNYVAFTPTNGTVTGTYQVTATPATPTTSAFAIPVYISFKANSAVAQATPMTVLTSYAPTAALTGPTTLIPTFAPSTATPTNVESISNCTTTLLFPYVTNASGFETGIAIVNTTTDNLGTIPGFPSAATPISGTCTVNFYPGGTATQPPAYTTPLIGVGGTTTGSVAANTLSTMSGATNFSGYAIASCAFPEAHGFAYIVDNFGTPSGTAEGYLAVVVPSNRGEGAGSSGAFGNNIPGITAQ